MDKIGYKRQFDRIRNDKRKYVDLLKQADQAINKVYLETNKKILELAMNVKSLWNRATSEERLELVKTIYSNPLLIEQTVEYTMKNHFSLLVEVKKSAKNKNGAQDET